MIKLNIQRSPQLLGDFSQPLLREDHDDDERCTRLRIEIVVLLHMMAVHNIKRGVIVALAQVAETVDLTFILLPLLLMVGHEQHGRTAFFTETIHRLE